MKKGLLLLPIIALLSYSSVQSQENEASDKLVFDISFDNWIHDVDSIKTRWNSFGFNFYFMYDIPLGKSRMSFAPGLGFSTSFVKNDARLDETTTSDGESITILRPYTDTDLNFVKHKNVLATMYFDVPLELRYRAKPNEKGKSFKLAIGTKQGVLMDSHTKRKYEDPRGDKKKEKIKKFDDLTRFRFGPMLRVGYGSFNFFAFYSVTDLFKQNQGPEINTFSAGFSISGL